MKVNAADDKAHSGVLTLKRGKQECRIFKHFFFALSVQTHAVNSSGSGLLGCRRGEWRGGSAGADSDVKRI